MSQDELNKRALEILVGKEVDFLALKNTFTSEKGNEKIYNLLRRYDTCLALTKDEYDLLKNVFTNIKKS